MLLPAAAFVAAVAATSAGAAAAAFAVVVIACALALRRTRIAGAFALAALAWCALRGAPPIVDRESRTLRIACTIVGDVRRADGAARFPCTTAGGVALQVTVRGDARAGERLVVRGRLEPFDEARNPGEPSRRAIALGEGLSGTLHGMVMARDAPDPRDARTWAARLREALAAHLRAQLPEPHATFVAGALWGERGTLPPDLRAAFQATGTVHVLVTAGLHLGVVAGLVLALLRLLRASRIVASLGTIPFVVAYAWLSGAHLPSQRAAVMVSAALLARACGARLVSWNALALAALAVAALWPAAVATVSFALSFSCVGAIVLFARVIEQMLAKRGLPERLREALALTIATQIGVWPLSAAVFGTIAPYAVLANALVVPGTALAIVCGAATLAFAPIPFAGTLAASASYWDVSAMLEVVRIVALLPGSQAFVAPPPAVAIVLYDAAAVASALVARRSLHGAIGLLALASAAVMFTTLRPPDGRLTITMLDVGQGDGIVVRTPRGRTILIDSGGRLERGVAEGGTSPAEQVGERVVLAYLRRQGIAHIDLLVNTHPHGDHVGGCSPIVEAMPVRMIFDSGQPYGGHAYRDCIASAKKHDVPIVIARRGLRWTSGDGVILDVLAPAEPFLAGTGDDVNENSIVAMLQYAGFRELLMGDAGEAAEARLIGSGDDLHAEVVKVGHHGSAYASTPDFAAHVRPAIAVISVGRHNTFGHPAAATIDTWRSTGSRILRTDTCGAITIGNSQEPHTMIRCEAF
ncbi:DNA internalization-related competence protein ComEC/Rec2 [Vulcanimicrobium alpinum]|uniref:DNA internalization-related competence protein ComEC/Rec2 n=1 Tax=Vulcanimicrobium alpinum TaxID=3016050 RepID=A0AAN1XTM0_UNVUL|nr:DNA internalization-related competence protein ComEC/Rec2 [Vulcanimicrobium alpinum]BDE04990.1 DNA internalization-related competence protein ComEC/Rec2 [Vulcanimicrobium alpinum]